MEESELGQREFRVPLQQETSREQTDFRSGPLFPLLLVTKEET